MQHATQPRLFLKSRFAGAPDASFNVSRSREFVRAWSVWGGVCGMLLLATATEMLAAEPHPGKAVYAQHCASCHGDRGEGHPANYPQPLVGDLSVRELSAYIAAAMPEGEPEVCVGPEAEAVAEYIHGEFYSVIAQVRNQPPEISFARLTVRQYRNCVTDLAGSFSWQGTFDDKRGLEGEYFKTKRRSNENRIEKRIDTRLEFNFGEGSPDAEKIEPEEYSTVWNGGILAPETGWYEIILKTENAGQLWLNNMRQPLIDARVKSGDETEYRESIYLLGGRVYPVRVEYNKSKNEPTGSVALLWKPPHSSQAVIAERYLSPNRFNFVPVITTDFPPDDKSVGYERGVSVSKAWNDATTSGALELIDVIFDRLNEYAKLPKEQEQHAEKLKVFCAEFASRAFRRPLTDEQKAFFVERQFAAVSDPQIATRRSLLLTLKSPRFLFPGAGHETWDDYRTAEWLALALWDSVPDETLQRVAREGKLNTRDQIRGQAERMVGNLRTRSKMKAFFHQWLQYDHFHELSKSSTAYPEFTPELVADLRTSLDLFIEHVLWSDSSDYRQLLLADEAFLNDRLAQFYGQAGTDSPDFRLVSFDPEHRSGILSHPYLLAGLAYEEASSPIHRGVFLARSLLGRFLKPPPIAVSPIAPDLHPDLTTRERVEQQTAATTCHACHGMINPLGFSLEHFDAAGRFRDQDRNKPIDASGIYLDRSGEANPFSGARQLGQFLVNSPEAHTAFPEQLFQYLIKQPVQEFAPALQTELKQEFVTQNFHMRKLLVAIATKSVLLAREQAQNRPTE